jgi:hypothetical protein
MGFFDDALGAIGQSLAQSASGYVQGVTGPLVGNMIGTLFGGGQATGGATLATLMQGIKQSNLSASDVALLQGQMRTQTADIENIGSQLTALSSAVNVIQSEVSAMTAALNEIAEEELFQAWQAVDLQMTEAITSIQTDYSVLAGFTANYANTSGSQVQTFMGLQQTGPLDSMNLINTLIQGGGGQSKGVLQLWSAMVAPLVQKGQIDYREAVEQYTTYYKKLVGAQLLAANILVEVSNYFAINGSHTAAMTAWNGYKANVVAQEPEFIQWLVPLVYSGVMAGVYDRGPQYTFVEGAMQLHAGLQALPGDSAGQGYYAPTSVFADAEAMLSALSVTDPVDRRIVVHMVFSDDQQGTFREPIDANPLTLTPMLTPTLTQGSSATVSPALVSKFEYTGFPAFDGSPDPNFFNGSFMYLYRHVYSQDASNPAALPDGSYQLTDLNANLPAVETVATGTQGLANFQETKVLAYTLSVSPTSQFDFMNFGAYMIGLVG